MIGGVPEESFESVGALVTCEDREDLASCSVSCTGTLVGASWVLTAGHCAYHISSVGDAGAVHFITATDVWSAALASAPVVHSVTIHERFDPADESAGGDIALLSLDREVEDAARVELAGPPSEDFIGTRLLCVGYGATADGEVASMGVRRSGTMSVTEYDSEWILAHDDAVNFCSGDSGGPCFLEGTEEVVGLGAFVFGADDDNACEGGTTGLVRTDVYVGWVSEVLRGSKPSSSEGTDQADEQRGCSAVPDRAGMLGLLAVLLRRRQTRANHRR